MTPERINTAFELFSLCVVQYPALYSSVLADVHVVQKVMVSSHWSDGQQGRDAAARLQRQANELGFSDLVEVFYEFYEFFCLRLVSL